MYVLCMVKQSICNMFIIAIAQCLLCFFESLFRKQIVLSFARGLLRHWWGRYVQVYQCWDELKSVLCFVSSCVSPASLVASSSSASTLIASAFNIWQAGMKRLLWHVCIFNSSKKCTRASCNYGTGLSCSGLHISEPIRAILPSMSSKSSLMCCWYFPYAFHAHKSLSCHAVIEWGTLECFESV